MSKKSRFFFNKYVQISEVINALRTGMQPNQLLGVPDSNNMDNNIRNNNNNPDINKRAVLISESRSSPKRLN